MSIGELAMLVNDNFNKPLNQQIRDMQYMGSYLFTSSTTFTPDKSGYYKVIVVGAGGASYAATSSRSSQGGSGAVAISTLLLNKSTAYTVTVTDAKSAFSNIVATSGGDGTKDSAGTGGTATGGQFNYNGLSGERSSGNSSTASSLGVGVFIPSLMKHYEEVELRYTSADDTEPDYINMKTGDGILGFGVSQHKRAYSYGASSRSFTLGPTSGCVLIIPLELTE